LVKGKPGGVRRCEVQGARFGTEDRGRRSEVRGSRSDMGGLRFIVRGSRFGSEV
jgi:hypothetical protein